MQILIGIPLCTNVLMYIESDQEGTSDFMPTPIPFISLVQPLLTVAKFS